MCATINARQGEFFKQVQKNGFSLNNDLLLYYWEHTGIDTAKFSKKIEKANKS